MGFLFKYREKKKKTKYRQKSENSSRDGVYGYTRFCRVWLGFRGFWWVWYGAVGLVGLGVRWWDCGLMGRVARVRGEKGALCGCLGADFGALCVWWEIRFRELSNL